MSSTTAQILGQLNVSEKKLPKTKKEFTAAINAIKEVAVPVAEIGGEVLTHVGIGALSGVTGLPLQKFGMFAAPAVGKVAGIGTSLALEGVKELGSVIIDAASTVNEAMQVRPK